MTNACAWRWTPPILKEEKVPKYLAKIIDDEIVAWLSWDAAHQPVKIDIDLSQLGHIRALPHKRAKRF